jgi:hypothetical protein
VPAQAVAAAASTDRWTVAWTRALEDLELDVAAAEHLLVAARHGRELPAVHGPLAVGASGPDDRPAWRPPTGLGPLPATLQSRAQALLERQLDVARRTAEAALLSRRHSQAAEAMRARPPAVPVYLDTQT